MRLVAHGSSDGLGDQLRLVHVGQQLRVRLVVVQDLGALVLGKHAQGRKAGTSASTSETSK